MIAEDRRKHILENLSDGVVRYDEGRVVQYATAAIMERLDPMDAIVNGLTAGMEIVGDLYDHHEYFVPELLMCADTLYTGLEILEPHVNRGESTKPRGQVVIGSVQGDVHDIGKNLVKMMFEVAGFEVHDLGRDVPLENFVEELRRTGAELVALSAMMTTTMMGMKTVISTIKETSPDTSVMVGGAPVTQEVAHLFGADGYAESAGKAVKEAIRLMARPLVGLMSE